MGWYRVVKTIKGRRYIYEQRTWREGKHVRTESRHLGPAGGEQGSSTAAAGDTRPSAVNTTATGILRGVARGLDSFAKAMLKQFDAGRWGLNATAQLGLTTAKAVRHTKRRHKQKILLGTQDNKKYYFIVEGNEYETQIAPPDEVWIVSDDEEDNTTTRHSDAVNATTSTQEIPTEFAWSVNE